MKKIVLILLFIACNILAQDKNYLDSVKTLTKSKIDTVRFWAYSELSWVLKETNKIEALQYANNLINESSQSNQKKWTAQGYNDVGIIYYRIGDLKSASENILKSLEEVIMQNSTQNLST